MFGKRNDQLESNFQAASSAQSLVECAAGDESELRYDSAGRDLAPSSLGSLTKAETANSGVSKWYALTSTVFGASVFWVQWAVNATLLPRPEILAVALVLVLTAFIAAFTRSRGAIDREALLLIDNARSIAFATLALTLVALAPLLLVMWRNFPTNVPILHIGAAAAALIAALVARVLTTTLPGATLLYVASAFLFAIYAALDFSNRSPGTPDPLGISHLLQILLQTLLLSLAGICFVLSRIPARLTDWLAIDREGHPRSGGDGVTLFGSTLLMDRDKPALPVGISLRSGRALFATRSPDIVAAGRPNYSNALSLEQNPI